MCYQDKEGDDQAPEVSHEDAACHEDNSEAGSDDQQVNSLE